MVMCVYGCIFLESAKDDYKALYKRNKTIFVIAFYRFFDDNDQFLYNFDIILQKYNETHVNKVSISFFINKHLLFDNDVVTVSNSCHFISKARLYTAFNLIDEQFAIELFDSI